MTIAVMQPTFNPWLGYFDMIDKVDSFILYDDVQLRKSSWQVRNKIMTPTGELFLTVPIKKGIHFERSLINMAQINDDSKWREKHLKSFLLNYKKALYFNEVYPFVELLYNKSNSTLADFNANLILSISNKIGITTPIIRSSSLSDIEGRKDDRLVQICKKLVANTYLSAKGSSDYIEEVTPGGQFPINNIELKYHNYTHPSYNQHNSTIFTPFIGIIDLLFNVGFYNSLAIIRTGREQDFGFQYYRDQILNKA